MSLKLNSFARIITQPLNIHKFIVSIPGAEIAEIVVAATSFPSEKLQYVTLHYQGEEIRYPTIPKNEHSWKVKVPESDNGIIRRQLDALKAQFYNQTTGLFFPNRWKSIKVTARDLQENEVFSTTMHGAWLIGRESVDLTNDDATKNWNWDYEFCFQWLEDADANNPGSIQQM